MHTLTIAAPLTAALAPSALYGGASMANPADASTAAMKLRTEILRVMRCTLAPHC
jgi:hypothetical protein